MDKMNINFKGSKNTLNFIIYREKNPQTNELQYAIYYQDDQVKRLSNSKYPLFIKNEELVIGPNACFPEICPFLVVGNNSKANFHNNGIMIFHESIQDEVPFLNIEQAEEIEIILDNDKKQIIRINLRDKNNIEIFAYNMLVAGNNTQCISEFTIKKIEGLNDILETLIRNFDFNEATTRIATLCGSWERKM